MTSPYPTVAEILELVSSECGVSVLDLVSARKGRAIARPRQVVYWLARYTTPLSFPQIGTGIGNRDHTSVMHGVAKIDELRGTNPDTKLLTDHFLHILKARQMRLIA